MAGVIAGAGGGAILMHSRGGILELASYAHANYPGGVTAAVLTELSESVRTATAGGISAEAIVVDPGLGFSKTVPQNLELLDQIGSLLAVGRPVMVGPSRKRFLAGPGDTSPADRDVATAAACVVAWERGARLFRVHDVAGVRDALALVESVADSDPSR
jgi:dihydropteroate synthase